MSRRQLQALILLSLTLLASAGSLCAEFDRSSKTASRDFWEPVSASVREISSPTPETQWETASVSTILCRVAHFGYHPIPSGKDGGLSHRFDHVIRPMGNFGPEFLF